MSLSTRLSVLAAVVVSACAPSTTFDQLGFYPRDDEPEVDGGAVVDLAITSSTRDDSAPRGASIRVGGDHTALEPHDRDPLAFNLWPPVSDSSLTGRVAIPPDEWQSDALAIEAEVDGAVMEATLTNLAPAVRMSDADTDEELDALRVWPGRRVRFTSDRANLEFVLVKDGTGAELMAESEDDTAQVKLWTFTGGERGPIIVETGARPAFECLGFSSCLGYADGVIRVASSHSMLPGR